MLTPVMIFVGGAGMLSLATALNAISVHGTCTAVFVAVAAVAAGLVASLQTLGKIKWIGWAGVASIMSAGASDVWDSHCGHQVDITLTSVIVLMVAVGVQDRPAEAPQEGPWEKGLVYWGQPNFAQASAAVSGVVLSYAGTSVHFPLLAEMREPRHYNRAMFTCQIAVICFYMVRSLKFLVHSLTLRSSAPWYTTLLDSMLPRRHWAARVRCSNVYATASLSPVLAPPPSCTPM